MSAPGQQDAATAAQTADTPEGTGTQDATQTNWEERYKEAQGWGTRLAQEKAQLEAEAQLARALRSDDIEQRREALRQIGLDFVNEETRDEGGEQVYDNDPRVLAQLQELQAWREQQEAASQQQTAAQQEAAQYQAYRQITDPQLKQMGVPDNYHEVIAGLALELPEIHTPQGPKPDLEGAWKQYLEFSQALDDVPEVQTRRQQKWAQTKPTRALVTPNGRAGTDVPDLKTHEGRMAAAMARITADQ